MKSLSRLTILCALFLGIGCASFRHNSVPVTESITTHLEQISKAADAATSIKVMSSAQRQSFARDIMLPAIAANKSFATCLLNASCNELPAELKLIAQTLLKGLTDFIGTMPQVAATSSLAKALTDALNYVNGLIGGKK